MDEKVKVSREVGEALNSAFKMYMHEENRENAILKHNFNGTWAEEREILHNIEPFELAKMLVNGYEIEETPEEKLLKKYNANKDMVFYASHGREINKLYDDINLGILMALDILGIQIKGINK